MIEADTVLMHGSCVAVGGNSVLILGASGSGKSGLALQMIALGAVLVADDRVALHRTGGMVAASAPATIKGLIEARGIGILNAATRQDVSLAFVVDLDQTAAERMPEPKSQNILGMEFALFSGKEVANLAAALMVKLGDG